MNYTDIKVVLPTNIVQALKGANSPSAANPFATIADITGSISGTVNFISKFTGANTIGNSSAFDTSTFTGFGVTAGVVSAASNFSVKKGTDLWIEFMDGTLADTGLLIRKDNNDTSAVRIGVKNAINNLDPAKEASVWMDNANGRMSFGGYNYPAQKFNFALNYQGNNAQEQFVVGCGLHTIDTGGNLFLYGAPDTASNSQVAYAAIKGYKENATNNNQQAYLSFLTNGGAGLIEALRINSSQVISVGTWNGTAIGAAYGGTGQTSYTIGDILYASGATTLSKLADVSVGSYLRSGGVGTAPLWSTLKLPNAATQNAVIFASSANMYGESANLTFTGSLLQVKGQFNLSNALGATSISFTDSGASDAYRALVNLASSTADLLLFRATGAAGGESFSETIRITNSAGDVGIGTGATVSARLHVVKTTEQLRVGYDATNYISTSVSSTGVTTISTAGTDPSIKILSSTAHKLGFWNATPIVQPASANQAALSLDVTLTGVDTIDRGAVETNFSSIQTLVNQLRSDLVSAGLIKGSA